MSSEDRMPAARGYIVCERRKSRPRVQVEVCPRCRWRRRCRTLKNYLQPTLFPLPGKVSGREAKRRSRAAH